MPAESSPQDHLTSQRPAHEPEGTSARGIRLGALVFLAALGLILFSVRGIMDWFRHLEPARVPGNTPAQLAVSPVRAWLDPVGDLAQLWQREDERLATYAWLDREKGVVRIPIEQAMTRMMARATPAAETRPAGAAPQER